jgi:uncharacterized protein YecT (DUF1311 family)
MAVTKTLLTAKEFDNYPFEEDKRYELDEGVFVVTDKPACGSDSVTSPPLPGFALSMDDLSKSSPDDMGAAKILLTILAALFFWASSAIAQDTADTRACFPGPSTTGKISEVTECLSKVQKTVEAELNEKYQQSISPLMLPPKWRASLQKSQRLWVAYRDVVCKTQGDSKIEGGQVPISLCMIKTTRERIADIETFYTISK